MSVTITAGRSGSFEITRDDTAVFSKLETGRFPADDEISGFAAAD